MACIQWEERKKQWKTNSAHNYSISPETADSILFVEINFNELSTVQTICIENHFDRIEINHRVVCTDTHTLNAICFGSVTIDSHGCRVEKKQNTILHRIGITTCYTQIHIRSWIDFAQSKVKRIEGALVLSQLVAAGPLPLKIYNKLDDSIDWALRCRSNGLPSCSSVALSEHSLCVRWPIDA